MSGEIRRPRMRGGLRRGRGVRVRGGRGSGTSLMADVVEVADRGGPSRRGRGRANRRHERPGPQNIDELVIHDIDELPEGRGLETAMHPKRKRMWQPSNNAPLPTCSSPELGGHETPPVAPPSPASSWVPSPAMFVECELQSGPASPMRQPSPPPPRRPRRLRDADISFLINHGSDDDSDEGNEEEAESQIIPRAIWSMLETPLDVDTGEEDPADEDGAAGRCEPADVLLETTEQPWGLNYFDWREFPNPPIPPELRRELFSASNVDPTTPGADPYSIFVDIWDRQIMEHIVVETNRYAQQLVSQMFDNRNLHPRSRISCWVETTVDELYVYFGLILGMGIVVKSRIEEYWSVTRDMFYTPLNSLTKRTMRPGQIAGLTSGDVDLLVWRDANIIIVAMISTYHSNAQQIVGESIKPILISDYNIMMGGVDKKDQLLAMYPVERKRTRVWYKKLFRRLLNVSVLNSYIIYKHTHSTSHRNFRISLIKSIMSKHSTSPPILPETTQNKADVTHHLAEFPKGKCQRLRRACTACKKQVRTFCVGCGRTVCMEPCFVNIHS